MCEQIIHQKNIFSEKNSKAIVAFGKYTRLECSYSSIVSYQPQPDNRHLIIAFPLKVTEPSKVSNENEIIKSLGEIAQRA